MADRVVRTGTPDSRLPNLGKPDEARYIGNMALKGIMRHPLAGQMVADDMADAQAVSDSVPRGAYANGKTAFGE